MTEIAVSVTELARFCHRSGDIDHRFTPSPSGSEGIAGHQRLYQRRPDTYQREHAVEMRCASAGLELTLRGRADGFDPAAELVEEIKTCRVPPQAIPAAVSDLHLAQGRLYGALISRRDGLETLLVRLTWFNIDSGEEYCRTERYSAAELQLFLDESLQTYARWLARVHALQQIRNESAAALAFPHGEFRPGQRQIAELAYKCIDQGSELLLEAPTGIGKTAAVLYPALKAFATGKHDRLAFVTARHVGRLAAEETLALFREKGFRGSALSLTARERICFSPGKACHADDCPFAAGYYDRLPAAMEQALELPSLRRQDIELIAREHEVCPYELSLDLLPSIDLVIADLHYVYSLYGLLGGAMDEDGLRWSVLLDEAHNLPGRARDMYSATLSKAALMRAKKLAPPVVAKALERVNLRLLALAKVEWQEPAFHSSTELPESLLQSLADFNAAVSDALGQDHSLLARTPPLADFYFDALHFLRVAEEWGQEYRCQLSRGEGRHSLTTTLNCLDPSRLLAERQQKAHAVTAFSATVSPLDWARESLGLAAEAVCTRSPSPFRAEQLRVEINSSIDTRYRQRQQSLPALVEELQQWLEQRPGNCIVYFPSYAYMQDAIEALREPRARTLWIQKREQIDSEREQLLALLRERRNVVAFCILGGVWGEGIDLPGEQLSSVVVVGVGMPQINRDTRELQAHFQRNRGQGFEFTFVYPGMQKVAQAIGRVIRSDSDEGHALLIDPRYAEPGYRGLLPPWWHYHPVPKSAI